MLLLGRTILTFCAMLFFVLLTACASYSPSSSTNIGAVPNQSEEPTQEATQSNPVMVTSYVGPSSIAAIKDGYYQVLPNPQGGCNIVYTDLASHQTIFLCSRANCLHSDDTCTSWFSSVTVNLFVDSIESNLFCVSVDSNGEFLWKMELNGGDRQLIYRCKTGESFRDAFAMDGDFLYFTIAVADGRTGGGGKELRRLNLTNGNNETILEYGNSDWLFSAYSGHLLFLFHEGTEFTYRSYNLDTHTFEDLYTYYSTGSATDCFARPNGQLLYIFEPVNSENAKISVLDLLSGHCSLLTEQFPYFGAENIVVGGFFDGYMSVSIWNINSHDTQAKQYLVDINNGTVYPIELTFEQGDITMPREVVAVMPDWFVITAGIVSQEVTLTSSDGTPYSSVIDCMSYALIRKEDYLHQRPNFILADATKLYDINSNAENAIS